MKYLAILKDSLLEALDTKVFYALVGLSGLVLLVVASVSYHPVTVEDEVTGFVGQLSWFLDLHRNKNADAPPTIAVADFQQTNAGASLWEADYRFTLVMHLAEGAKGDPAAQLAAVPALRQALRQRFPYLNDVQVKALPAPEPGERRFEVTTRGTKVTRGEDWPHEPTLFFAVPVKIWHGPVGEFVYFWENTIVNSLGASVALLISVVVTAFFIPNLLRRGTVDLLLVKPIRRSTLLVYKYIGGLVFMFLNTTLVVAGLWLILGLRTGMWGPGFLASIGVLTFQFAFYYAISTLFGVLTRSAIVSILMSCLGWFLFSLVIGQGYRIIDATRKLPEPIAAHLDEGEKKEAPPRPLPEWVYTAADVIHAVTPRLHDLDALTDKLIAADTLPEYSPERKTAEKRVTDLHWGEAVGVTLLYIAVLLALACWRMETKEY